MTISVICREVCWNCAANRDIPGQRLIKAMPLPASSLAHLNAETKDGRGTGELKLLQR